MSTIAMAANGKASGSLLIEAVPVRVRVLG